MAGKHKGGRPGGIPWSVALLLHIAFDLATQAAWPDCGQRVVLYICSHCKGPFRPSEAKAVSGQDQASLMNSSHL
jgi:hypothetical protein